eukprot:1140736-Pelagomonas_calceolata.AAC.2
MELKYQQELVREAMDTLRGLPEAVEAPDEFASSIEARDDALACLAASPGVGALIFVPMP